MLLLGSTWWIRHPFPPDFLNTTTDTTMSVTYQTDARSISKHLQQSPLSTGIFVTIISRLVSVLIPSFARFSIHPPRPNTQHLTQQGIQIQNRVSPR